jgi:hypothetical protein
MGAAAYFPVRSAPAAMDFLPIVSASMSVVHTYCLYVEGHTSYRGYEFIPVVGSRIELQGAHQAPLGRVLAWVEDQREPLRAALAEMQSRGARFISITARLPISHDCSGGEVRMISADGDLVENIRHRLWKFYREGESPRSL